MVAVVRAVLLAVLAAALVPRARSDLTMCVPTPMKVEPTCPHANATCSTGNVTLAWPSGLARGWLPLRFKYNERQTAVTLQAVDEKGVQRTFVIPTLFAAIFDMGSSAGARIIAQGMDQFFRWPIVVLNQSVGRQVFNTSCWSILS